MLSQAVLCVDVLFINQLCIYSLFYLFFPCLCLFLYFTSTLTFDPYLCGKINDLNLDEEAFGWSVSQYPERKKAQEKLTLFLRLYETATDFIKQREKWLHGPLTSVNPDKVKAVEKLLCIQCRSEWGV